MQPGLIGLTLGVSMGQSFKDSRRTQSSECSQRSCTVESPNLKNLSEGAYPLRRISYKSPDLYGGNPLKSLYRTYKKKLWFGDLNTDCLYRAYEDNNHLWFALICRYYPISLVALELLLVILNDDSIEKFDLNQQDCERVEKIRPKHNKNRDLYIAYLTAEIGIYGAPLVETVV